MLILSDVTLKRGEKLLFDHLDLIVHDGHRVGLVGRNGVGKSTLFKLIRGRILPEAGEVKRPSSWEIAHLAQETPASRRPAIDWVLDGDVALRRIEAGIERADAAGDDAALAHLYPALEDAGGYTARARAARILNGLGFAAADFERPYETFSGGWRIRLNLAQTLMRRAEVLLLDEPTNHLDLDATLWLESHLAGYPGTLIIIAHDQQFLDAVATEIVLLSGRRAHAYRGNYTAFERQRAEQLAREGALAKKQAAQAAHIERFVARFRAKASKARQVQSRLKALERLQSHAAAHVDSPYRFALPSPEKTSPMLLELEHATLGYDGAAVLDDVTLTIAPGDRVGILGRNGAGKSTLVKTLAGELPPIAGELKRGYHSRVGYFAQQQLEIVDREASPLAHLLTLDPRVREQEARDHLGGWGFPGDMALAPSGVLSGGEKARLVLALIAWQRPALLLLDEPTNHLDLDMRRSLAVALGDYTGAVVLIAHDRELMAGAADRYVLVSDRHVTPFEAGMEGYVQAVRQAQGPAKAGGGRARKRGRRDAAALRRRARPLEDDVRRLEREVERLGAALAALDARLGEADSYATLAPGELSRIMAEQGRLRRDLERAEAEWLERMEALESFLGGG